MPIGPRMRCSNRVEIGAPTALEHELKQHVAGVAVDALLAGRFAGLRSQH